MTGKNESPRLCSAGCNGDMTDGRRAVAPGPVGAKLDMLMVGFQSLSLSTIDIRLVACPISAGISAPWISSCFTANEMMSRSSMACEAYTCS